MSLRAASARHSLLGAGIATRLAIVGGAIALLWLTVHWALH